jgi:hypothetical protein
MKSLCHQNMNAVSILPVLVRPRSRGEVRLQSTSPWDPPLLDPKYLTEEEDLDLLVEAVQTAFQLVNSSKRLQEHKFQVVKEQPHYWILLGILLLHVLRYVQKCLVYLFIYCLYNAMQTILFWLWKF